MLNRKQKQIVKGQCLIEVLAGIFILIPITLFILDLVVLVLANSANDTLAKNCARAAANVQKPDQAKQAALKVLAGFQTSTIITAANLVDCNYNNKEDVQVETKISVKLPVPVLGINFSPVFHARAVEPIVGVSSAPGVDS